MQLSKLKLTEIALPSKKVKEQFQEAVSKSLQLLNDVYEEIAISTCHWVSDDTGGAADCEELIKTMSKLHGSRQDLILTHWIDSEADTGDFMLEVLLLKRLLNRNKRTLFIFHYAGHATANSTSNDLILTEIDQATQLGAELEGKFKRSFTPIKSSLIEASSHNPNMDVLMIMDCCCAAVAGRGKARLSGRVEFVAATTPTGVPNQRSDGQTFTQAWCAAFQTLFDKCQEFTTDDIITIVNVDRKLAQFPVLYVNQEGSGIPITFNISSSILSIPKKTEAKVLLVAFHISEDPDDAKTVDLIACLEKTQLPTSIVGIYRTSSTVLLVELMELVMEIMPHCGVILWPTSKTIIVENGHFKSVSVGVLATKILNQSGEKLPSEVKVNLEVWNHGTVETVWELKYLNSEIYTILWENRQFKLGKVPEGGSGASLYFWNESPDGKLRRIRMYPVYSRNIIIGEVWTSLEKLTYFQHNSTSVGENISFKLK
jgi:hypothetical protein